MSEHGFNVIKIHGRKVGLSKKLGEKLLKTIRNVEPGFRPVYISYHFQSDYTISEVDEWAAQQLLRPVLQKINKAFHIEGALSPCCIMKLASPVAQQYLEGDPDYEGFQIEQVLYQDVPPFHYMVFVTPVIAVNPDAEESQDEFIARLEALGIESCKEGELGIEVELTDWRDPQ